MAKDQIDYNELLSAFSKQVRQAYIDGRRSFEHAKTGSLSTYSPGPYWDGGVVGTRETKKYRQPIWPLIVKNAIRDGIHPCAFVREIFLLLQAGRAHSIPQPNQLTGDYAITLYRTHFPKEAERIAVEDAFKSQRVALSLAMTELDGLPSWPKERIKRHVITDSTAPLSALFRYCCAVDTGQLDVAERYRELALNQYVLHKKHYDEVWGDYIPDDMKRAGQEYVNYIANISRRLERSKPATSKMNEQDGDNP